MGVSIDLSGLKVKGNARVMNDVKITGYEDAKIRAEPAEKLRRLERLQALQEDLSSDWLKARVGCKTDILLEGASRKQDGEDAATESWQGRDPWGDAVNVSLPAGIGKPGLIVPVIIVTAKKHSLIGELRG